MRWKGSLLALLGVAAASGVAIAYAVGGSGGSAPRRPAPQALAAGSKRPGTTGAQAGTRVAGATHVVETNATALDSATTAAATTATTTTSTTTAGTTTGSRPPPSRPGHRLIVGTAEDAGKQASAALALSLTEISHRAGFDSVLLSSRWTRGATRPSAAERTLLGNAIRAARQQRMQVFVFVWHGLSGGTPRTPAARRQFAAYAAALAREFPQISSIIVGNEPNLNTFWLPQFGPGGSDLAAQGYFQLLALTYDALKAVSPRLEVIGGALAPRGSDRPKQKRATHSPAQFIKDLGAAYRASGRRKPIMDAFAMHPYMRTSAISPLDTNHAETTITISDYPRLVRLLATAFRGTGQRGGTLPIYYTEFGVQTSVPPADRHAYNHLGSAAAGDAVDAKTQARYYFDALAAAACQPTVRALFIFHTFDEADLRGWQSGLYYADLRPKASLPAFRVDAAAARAARLTRCTGTTFIRKK